MSEVYEGFIARLSTKSGNKRDGSTWTKYSAKIEKKDGTEYEKWVSLGFDNPDVKEGDYVRVEVTEKNGYLDADLATLQKKKNPPARTQKAQSTQRANGGGTFRRGGGFGGGGNRFDGTGIQNRTNPEDAKRMSYANARTAAISLVEVLLANDALPKTGAQTKAGQAARFEEVVAAVNKLTVQFHNDGISLRLLETVADVVTNTGADGPLPDTKEDKKDDGRSAGTGPAGGGTAESFEDDAGDDDTDGDDGWDD